MFPTETPCFLSTQTLGETLLQNEAGPLSIFRINCYREPSSLSDKVSVNFRILAGSYFDCTLSPKSKRVKSLSSDINRYILRTV